ncbi:RING-type E3 ubiquitin transferase [Ranunculus cassubicifolius]
MDDSCAVCAETLEWVAYGSCGHREVCSTCVARLRFICEDRRCCICKTESDVIFVTKAAGDYTTTISDFSILKSGVAEGKNGSYWFHQDTGAYFDDCDHYKMIIAMCKLSCSICDKGEEQGGNDGSKRKGKYNSIEQLRSHLFHRHKKIMCNLCLEGRKVFICEQKLYTRTQLEQHIKTGDSEVDGSESDRGGFMGHPTCEFCKKSFYGENELYTHMSTEHFTCHICQRQNPGQFEYYKNYDDLEMHFRSTHFLCENEACLAKKFIVFTSESEMKRHNAIEHGGNMSRSKRNAVLQIPTSFRYRREQDGRRGRGRGSHHDPAEDDLSSAIQASLETTDNSHHGSSSSAQLHELDEIVLPFESLSTADSEASVRYRQALGNSSTNVPLGELSFPPLPMAPSNPPQQQPRTKGLGKNTLAARLRNGGTVNVLHNANSWGTNTKNQGASFSSSSSTTSRPRATPNHVSSSPQPKPKAPVSNGYVSSSSISASSSQTRPPITNGSLSSQAGATSSVSASSSLTQSRPATGPSSSSNGSLTWSTPRVIHSASVPNLVGQVSSSEPSMSDFPPVSAMKKTVTPPSNNVLKVEDVQTANKSLVERIRSALDFDESKYLAFRDLSAEYRKGEIGPGEYLSYVQQFGLTHLVFELARLCPDPQKQRDLLETYNISARANNARENGISVKIGKSKGKGKSVEAIDTGGSNGKLAERSFKDKLADDVIGTVKKLQASYKPLEENVEVLSKDGYRRSNGNSISKPPPPILAEQLTATSINNAKAKNDVQSAGGGTGSSTSGAASGGSTKQPKKKTSKFNRVRLGESYDDKQSEPEKQEMPQESTSDGVPVRGVWRNGGGQKLVSLTQKGK